MASKAILAAKKKKVQKLADELKEAKSLVITDYKGLTVAQDTEMRNAYREASVEYKVVKNSIVSRALESLGITGLDEVLTGPTAVAYSVSDVVVAPQVSKKYIDKFKKMEIKGGVLEGEVTTVETIKALANIPATDVLYGQLVAGLMFPITSLAMTLGAMAKKAEEANLENVSDIADLVVEAE